MLAEISKFSLVFSGTAIAVIIISDLRGLLEMAETEEFQEQKHPQARSDREIVNTLLNGQPTDYNLAELARLLIRYRGFPGAKDIQADLQKVLHLWRLTEEQLYAKTRKIHAKAKVYKNRGKREEKVEEEDDG